MKKIQLIKNAKKIVIKIGSSLLVEKGKSKETFKALSYYFQSLSLIDIIFNSGA